MKVQTKAEKKQKEQEYEEATLNSVTLRVYESGYANVKLTVKEGSLIVNGFIREGKDGLFFAMPSYKDGSGKWHNQAYVLGDELNSDIAILVKQLTAE